MKTGKDQNERLEQLFAAAREERVADNGFTDRVVARIVLPPSKNMYRVPAFITLAVSAVLLFLVVRTGFTFQEVSDTLGQKQEQYHIPKGEQIASDWWDSISRAFGRNSNR